VRSLAAQVPLPVKETTGKGHVLCCFWHRREEHKGAAYVPAPAQSWMEGRAGRRAEVRPPICPIPVQVTASHASGWFCLTPEDPTSAKLQSEQCNALPGRMLSSCDVSHHTSL